MLQQQDLGPVWATKQASTSGGGVVLLRQQQQKQQQQHGAMHQRQHKQRTPSTLAPAQLLLACYTHHNQSPE
jgi:hypothetical protein